jgi:hypothetical protein
MGWPKANTTEIAALPLNGLRSQEHCKCCPWLEWEDDHSRCMNRHEFICRLHLSELFEDF